MSTERDDVDPELYRIAVDQAKDYAVLLLDPAGRILTWNTGAERIKGYSPQEIIGRHFSVFYPREAVDSGWPTHELRVAATEGHFNDEGWRIRRDGSRFWASVAINALRGADGKLLGFSKITRDLTDRRRYEEALRQSEERFRLLVDGVVDYAVFMLDHEGFVTSWNSGAQRIKGYRHDEIIGKHVSRFYTPEDIDAGLPWEDLVAARRLGRSEQEGWRVKKSGERFWARAVLSALYGPEGRLRGFTKVTQDLTDQRYMLDLEKAAKNLNEFIAVLAHELRNPLASVRSAVQVMARTSAEDPVHHAMHKTIDRQSAQLVRIVNDLLDIARITRGALALERRPVDLTEILRGSLESSMPAIESGGHSLEMDAPRHPLHVDGDTTRLTQLVANLLDNAARYTAAGGRITVKASAEGRWAVIRVRDSGRGIAPQDIDRVFDMFAHGRTTRPRAGEGLGIGLALARRIAELHGGTLNAHSEGEGKGSEFMLRVPLSDAPEAAHGQGEPAAPGASLRADVPRRVLVVDDNVDAATTLNALLQTLGHETSVATGGLEALQKASEFRPEIVLLDIGLPDIDGYEVARQLRKIKVQHSFRIVAVTGWGQEPDRQKSQEAGFDRHLVKPVATNELLQILTDRNGSTLH
jgi:PAS domain S-box-containing protein